jgi:hypothetical protein
MVKQEGIDPHLVSSITYRDEADVQNDLDLLEREGKLLCSSIIRKANFRLYNKILQTGWGAERIKLMQTYPPCNPDSGLLHDRMILLRMRLALSIEAVSKKAGIFSETWANVERSKKARSEATLKKIECFLEEHGFPKP